MLNLPIHKSCVCCLSVMQGIVSHYVRDTCYECGGKAKFFYVDKNGTPHPLDPTVREQPVAAAASASAHAADGVIHGR